MTNKTKPSPATDTINETKPGLIATQRSVEPWILGATAFLAGVMVYICG